MEGEDRNRKSSEYDVDAFDNVNFLFENIYYFNIIIIIVIYLDWVIDDAI